MNFIVFLSRKRLFILQDLAKAFQRTHHQSTVNILLKNYIKS